MIVQSGELYSTINYQTDVICKKVNCQKNFTRNLELVTVWECDSIIIKACEDMVSTNNMPNAYTGREFNLFQMKKKRSSDMHRLYHSSSVVRFFHNNRDIRNPYIFGSNC